MNRIDICKNIIQSIKDYITTPEKLEPHRVKNHFVRKRKLSLFQVIMYLLYTSKASMFQNLSRIREDLECLDFPDISKQALSKARQFINPALFKELYYLSVDLFYKQLPSRKLWNGYHLFAIDGSKIELPNSKSNFEFFGEMFGYPDPSRRFTMGLGSIVYDVLDDYIVHASFQRYLASERSAALEHLHNLEDLNIYQNSVIIFDRGYYSEDMFRYCVEHQHLCLMRLKQNYNIAKKCFGDIITVLPGNTKDGTENIKIRVIEVILNDGTKAAYNKINRIVDDVRSSSIEVVATQPIKHQCYNCHAPRSLLISNHEAEKREQHVEHKNNRQCPTHTNDRNIRIWQKSLA